MMYYASYDVALLALGNITLATSGKPNVVVNISAVTSTDAHSVASSLFLSHVHHGVTGEDPAASTRFAHYAQLAFSDALQAAIQTEATAQGWTSVGSIDVSVANATGIWTFTYGSAFTLAWSTAAGAHFMSFASASTTSSATSHAGTITPTYAVSPTLDGVSDPSVDYEPSAIAERVVADSGDGFGISRSVSPLYRDWLQQYETKAKTLRRSADSTHPWTLQDLFEHCRTAYPFVVEGGFGSSAIEVFSLRSEGASWKPQRASPGNDTQFHVPFQTIVEGVTS